MNFPADLKYTKRDEWIKVDGNVGTLGISDFAQDQLSDIVYLEVSLSVGDTAAQDEAFGTIESVKAASDIYMPVSGKVLEINEALFAAPEAVNGDPYGSWMIKIEISDPAELDGLLDAAAYEADTKGRA
jgi:glycine cleavage system H protein